MSIGRLELIPETASRGPARCSSFTYEEFSLCPSSCAVKGSDLISLSGQTSVSSAVCCASHSQLSRVHAVAEGHRGAHTHTHTLCPHHPSLSPLGYHRPTYWHSCCFHVCARATLVYSSHSVTSRKPQNEHMEMCLHMVVFCCLAARWLHKLLPFLGWVAACTPHHNNTT